MSVSNSRNVALRQTNRPGSARRTTGNDPLKKNDPPDPCSSEVDFSAFLDAIETIQKVDLNLLRRRLNGTVPCDLKNGQNGKDTNTRWVENVDWETKYMDLKEKIDKFTKQIEDKQVLEDKLKHITAQLKTTEQTSSEQKKEIIQLQQRVESGDKSLKALNQKLKECMNELELKEKRLQTQQKAMKEVTKAKDDALTRLSHQMGQQLSEGNPNITDLSDQNRPSKLGEIYSELYDNEWTDAFEVLTETFSLDDKSAIEMLRKIMLESSKHASDVSQSAMKTIENLLSGSSDGATSDCKRMLREARKHVDIKKADTLLQDFQEKLTRFVKRIYLTEKKVAVYIKKSFQLCWLMSIQDPPVVLSKDPEIGSKFDTNRYKHYTHSGNIIDYVVWPALLLHKDGPLLAKGVAEPYTTPRAKSAPAIGRPEAKNDISFDRQSQIKYDEKVRESTSRSDKMDRTQYGNDAPLLSKSGHSPIVTSKSGISPIMTLTSSDSPIVTSKSGHSPIVTSTSGDSPIVTSTYTTPERKYRDYSTTPTSPTQSTVSERKQLYEYDVFKSRYDKVNFQRFCQDVLKFREHSLRLIYETDYDRYYTLYLNQKYGHYTFT